MINISNVNKYLIKKIWKFHVKNNKFVYFLFLNAFENFSISNGFFWIFLELFFGEILISTKNNQKNLVLQI